ncbi:MAG: hypothetical protein ACKOWE_04050 [Micrococcales bacterium]
MAKKKRRYGGAALSVINELFQPSAASAQIVIEEQKEARVALPSPIDKDFKKKVTITLPQKDEPKDPAS